jgi:hypothetical protein
MTMTDYTPKTLAEIDQDTADRAELDALVGQIDGQIPALDTEARFGRVAAELARYGRAIVLAHRLGG